MKALSVYTLDTLRVDIDSKICELQTPNLTDKQYDKVLADLNTLMIYRAKLT